jgi:hypothetical protein
MGDGGGTALSDIPFTLGSDYPDLFLRMSVVKPLGTTRKKASKKVVETSIHVWCS